MAKPYQRCACCGQVIPPKLILPRVKQRIYDYVSRHPEGCDRWQIMNYVYEDDPNGGPNSTNVINVHIVQINKRLKPDGLRIWAGGGRGLYTLSTI